MIRALTTFGAAGLALYVALSGPKEPKVGKASTRLTLSPKGFVNGPAEASVRIVIDHPTPEWFCPTVTVEAPGKTGDMERSGPYVSDCPPWDDWVSEFDVVRGFRRRPDGGIEWRVERPHRRWDYTWRRTLYSGENPITVRLEQGKEVLRLAANIPLL